MNALFDSRPNGDASFTPIFLRIAFHDAGTWSETLQEGGPNASLQFELGRPENSSVVARFGWPLIRQVKEALNGTAAESFSLADVIALAPTVGIARLGGNADGGRYAVKVGRTDATRADPVGSEHQLPKSGNVGPALLQELTDNFARQGFNQREMIVLSGAHTIGRIPGVSSGRFDNDYYQSLLRREGGLGSDRVLLLEPARSVVEEFANDNSKFLREFRAAYTKLSNFGYT